MENKIHLTITEITIMTGKTKAFRLRVDDKDVEINVDEALFTNYQNQFYREKPTAAQRLRFATLLSLMRSAYRQGLGHKPKAK